MNWLILHGWIGKTFNSSRIESFPRNSSRKSYSLTKQTLVIWAFHFCEGHLPSLAQYGAHDICLLEHSELQTFLQKSEKNFCADI